MLLLFLFKPSNEKILSDNAESMNAIPSSYEETNINLYPVNVVPPKHIEMKSKIKTFEYPPGYVKPNQ